MRILGAFVPLLLGLALAGAVRPVWTIDPDAAAYVSLARGLAVSGTYALDGVPHGKYPPGLPLLLAGLMRLSGPQAYDVFHAALLGLFLLGVGLALALVRRLGYPPVVALAVCLATGLSQTLFELSVRYLRSEVPFLALQLAALLACLAALAPRPASASLARRLAPTLAAAALVVAAMSFRLAGVTLLAVPAWRLLFPRERGAGRRRAALLLVVGVGALAAWSGRAAAIRQAYPEAPDYRVELLGELPRDLTKTVRLDMPRVDAAGLLARVAGNVEVLARASAVLLSNVDKAGARLPVGALALAVVLVGLASLLARKDERRDVALYTLATLGLYLLWPFQQQERFYVPLLPILLLAAGEGAVRLYGVAGALARHPTGRAATVATGGLVLLALVAQRSDDPTVLGRWSKAYAALLGGLAAALGMAALWIFRRRSLPALRPAHALLGALLFAPTWFFSRFVEWPVRVADFAQRRAEVPREGPLARIDSHPVLEEVAVWLAAHTPPDTVVMSDVPKMLALLSGRRCVPLTYHATPPGVVAGEADLLFFTHDPSVPDAAAAVAASAAGWEAAATFAPLELGDGLLTPTIWRLR